MILGGMQHTLTTPPMILGGMQHSFYHEPSHDSRWNATYTDYSSHVAPDVTDYSLRHCTASSNGLVVTLDSTNGMV